MRPRSISAASRSSTCSSLSRSSASGSSPYCHSAARSADIASVSVR
jgi:hypothetical protein